jgi:hypothetical protein
MKNKIIMKNLVASLLLGATGLLTSNLHATNWESAQIRAQAYINSQGRASIDMDKMARRKYSVRYEDPITGNTMLHVAAIGKDPKIVEALIQAGAFLNVKNKVDIEGNYSQEGYTPLEFATAQLKKITGNTPSQWSNVALRRAMPHLTIIDILKAAESHANEYQYLTPQEEAQLYICSDCDNSPIGYLGPITAGRADVNYQDPDTGNTMLHAAAINRCPEIVKALVDAGADLSVKNKVNIYNQESKKGYTPLEFARTALKTATETLENANPTDIPDYNCNLVRQHIEILKETIEILKQAEKSRPFWRKIISRF